MDKKKETNQEQKNERNLTKQLKLIRKTANDPKRTLLKKEKMSILSNSS